MHLSCSLFPEQTLENQSVFFTQGRKEGMRYEVGGVDVPQCTWVATAHREADGGDWRRVENQLTLSANIRIRIIR